MSRLQVIGLYRKILRAGAKWQGSAEESQYIIEEARSLFRKNMDLTQSSEISAKLDEAESRLELGLHYKNPYPRMYYANPGSTGKHVQKSRAVYMDSLE